jgi:hypothetical protein
LTLGFLACLRFNHQAKRLIFFSREMTKNYLTDERQSRHRSI